jgi:transposase
MARVRAAHPTTGLPEQRQRFVIAASRRERSVTALCREFEISRQTGHRWLNRYRAGGSSEAAERSRRPLHSPLRTAPEVEQGVVDLRRRYPDWGAPKLLVLLGRAHPEWRVCERPAAR